MHSIPKLELAGLLAALSCSHGYQLPDNRNLSDAQVDYINSGDGGAGLLYHSIDTSSMPDVRPNGFNRDARAWRDVVYAPPSGKLYAVPAHADSMMMIDPSTNATALNWLRDGHSGFASSVWDEKFYGMEYCPLTEKLYASPRNADHILIVDPATNMSDRYAIEAPDGGQAAKYGEIVYAPNTRKLYAAPYTAVHMLIVDPATNQTDSSSLSGFTVGSAYVPSGTCRGGLCYKFIGIEYAPNTGKIYLAPSFVTSVIVVDPVHNVMDASAMADVSTNRRYEWIGIEYANSTGKLYCAPHYTNRVLIINPETNETDTQAFQTMGEGRQPFWHFLRYNPVSRLLYAAPDGMDSVLVINPAANSTSQLAISSGFGDHSSCSGSSCADIFQWVGMEFAPNVRRMFSAPTRANAVVVVADWLDPCIARSAGASGCNNGCYWHGGPSLCLSTTPPPTTANPTTPAPTMSPSTTPSTSGPTTVPSSAPSQHPCTDGTHGCDQTAHGICTIINYGVGYRCGCEPTHRCSDGSCSTLGHSCVWITDGPTPSPTPAPTISPTLRPTQATTATTATTTGGSNGGGGGGGGGGGEASSGDDGSGKDNDLVVVVIIVVIMLVTVFVAAGTIVLKLKNKTELAAEPSMAKSFDNPLYDQNEQQIQAPEGVYDEPTLAGAGASTAGYMDIGPADPDDGDF